MCGAGHTTRHNSRSTKSILMTVNDLGDRWFKPVEVGGKEGIVFRECPVQRVVEKLPVRIDVWIIDDVFNNESCEGACACSGVQSSLWDACTLWADDLEEFMIRFP